MSDRRLKITKIQADRCKELNEAATRALHDMDIYTASILNGHNITNGYTVVGINDDDDGHVLIVRQKIDDT